MNTLYIIIPAYNEEQNIENVAREWHEALLKFGSDASRLVVIDDGSRDKTYEKLCALEAQLPRLIALTKPNGGHGATVLYGYKYAVENGANFIFQTDSDGQTLASEFEPFWAERETYAAIIGKREKREDGWSRVFVTKVLKLVLKLIFKRDIPDANTPYRLMRREILSAYIPRIPNDFNLTNVLLTTLLVDAGEKVKFIPITFRPRQAGKNSINLRKIVKIGIQAVKDFSAINRQMKASRAGYEKI